MRVAILSWGSRGDVAPMAYVGAEFARRGDEVVMLAPPDLVDIPRSLGLDARPVGPEMRAATRSDAGRRWLADPGDTRAGRELSSWFRADTEDTVNAALDACAGAGADLIVAGFYFEALSTCVAEAHSQPVAFVQYAPWRHVPDSFVEATDAPAAPGLRPDAVALRLVAREMWRASRGDVSSLRTRLGLPPTRLATARRADALGVLEVQAFSPALVRGLEDWSPLRPLTGFLRPDPQDVALLGEADTPPGLDDWLAAGDPPLCVGFGSIPVLTTQLVARLARAAGSAGLRLLVHPGGSAVGPLPEGPDLFRLRGPVDLDAVLPRCAAAVHHGGAGTTGTSCRAGVPTLVCSLFGDQPFWGDMVVRRGVGAHLRFASMSDDDLTACVEHLTDHAVRRRAAELGREMAAEPAGVPRAVDLLLAHAQR